jgi:hypothetical protein
MKIYKHSKSKDIRARVKDLEAVPHIEFGIKNDIQGIESDLRKKRNAELFSTQKRIEKRDELRRELDHMNLTHPSKQDLKDQLTILLGVYNKAEADYHYHWL